MKGTDTDQNTLWQFTLESSKEAVRLYFEPVQKVGASGYLVAAGARSRPPQWK